MNGSPFFQRKFDMSKNFHGIEKAFDPADLGRIINRNLPAVGFMMSVLLATVASAITLPGPTPRSAEDDCGGAQPAPDRTVHRRQFGMGTWLDVTIQGETRAQALAATEAVLEAVEVTERRLSTWRDDSELAFVNHNAHSRAVEISRTLGRELADAMEWSRRTSGAFSPVMGSLVAAWDLRGSGRVPGKAELSDAREASGSTDVILQGHRVRLRRKGLQFEEGGFGKGAALREALTVARTEGAIGVVLDFGGQVAVGGVGGTRSIGIADPRDRQAEVATLYIESGSAATSGLSERTILVEGIRYGHILDPRDGRPARDWGAVTVVAADPFAADCVSTALYVMGPVAGARWAARQPDIDALFVEVSDGTVRCTATEGLRSRLSPAPHTEMRWIPDVEVRQNGPPMPTGRNH